MLLKQRSKWKQVLTNINMQLYHKQIMTDEKEKEFLTKEEAAELIGVHPETIRRWHLKEGLKVYKFGRTLRIRRQDLLDFLSQKSK